MTLEADWGVALEEIQHVYELADKAKTEALAARDQLVRDLRGEGFTVRETAALLGISHQRVSQIDREDWGTMPATTAAERLATAREAFQAAKHAQKLREERYAMGYRAETRGFYGDPSVAAADETETPVRWHGFHEGKASA